MDEEFMGSSPSLDPFLTGGFLGNRIKKNNLTHYHWLRMDVGTHFITFQFCFHGSYIAHFKETGKSPLGW